MNFPEYTCSAGPRGEQAVAVELAGFGTKPEAFGTEFQLLSQQSPLLG